jgi:hypothetical protein
METTKKNIPNYIFEDLLFRRRLERDLGDELQRLYNLLVEQVRLLREREALMADVSGAVQRRWDEEKEAERCIHPATATEENKDAE